MHRFFLKYQKAIIWAVVIGFLAGGTVMFSFQRLSSPARGSPEEIVLVVEGREINRATLYRAYDNLIQYYTQLYQMFGMDFQEQFRGTEGAFRAQQYIAQAAEGLIRQTLIDNEAKKFRVTVAKAELEAATERRYQEALAQFQGKENLENYLASQRITVEQYRQSLQATEEARLKEDQLRRIVVGPIEPTEDVLLAYYQEHQDRYQTEPEKIKIAHILVSDSALADTIIAEASAPDADFAALAREYSQDENTKEKGGEMDWFPRGGSGLSREVEDAAFALEIGAVTLVSDKQGYHIVKLLDRKPAVYPPFSEIRNQVEEDYIREEGNRRWNDWYTQARRSARIEVRDPVLLAFITYPDDKNEAAKYLVSAKEGEVHDLYLDYYIGRCYEQLYLEVGRRRAELEGKEFLSPEEEAELRELSAQEAEYKRKAIAAYIEFAETGEGDEALFNRLVGLDPKNPLAHFRLGEIYRERGQYIQADREYQLALDAQGDFVAALIGQGDVAMAMQLYDRAIDRYQEALELEPENRRVELRLAEAYVRGGKYDEAQPLVSRILATDPKNTAALLLMGDLVLGLGDPEGAISHYEAAQKLRPTSDIQLKLAGAYFAADRLDEARKHYEDIIRQFPGRRAEAYLGLGDVYRKLGDVSQALDQYRQALPRAVDTSLKVDIAKRIVELAPDDVTTRFRLAGYYREQYKYDAAIREYEAILVREPGNINALIGLGDCYVPKTQYDTALYYYQQALMLAETEAQRLSIYDKIVAAEEKRAGPQGKLSSAGLEALWQRALIYRDRGETKKAKADLAKIHEVDPTFRTEELLSLLAELGAEEVPQVGE